MLEMSTLPFLYPILMKITSRGSGIIVTVPGFTADDNSMYLLRKFLTDLGYECFGWEQGSNTHIDPDAIEKFANSIDQLHRDTGRQLHLIGHSLGGVFAREVAKSMPHAVKSVITLGSPFNDPENSVCAVAKYVYEVVNKNKPKKEMVAHLLESIQHPPQCKTTCFYSKLDGIVHWSSCMQTDSHDHVDNVHIPASHAGMAHNPVIMYKIANILHKS